MRKPGPRKRPAEDQAGETQTWSKGKPPIRKKQRVVIDAPTSEPITSSRHMRMLLGYETDSRKARHGLQSFKLFLDALNSPTSEGNTPENRNMLLEFLESQAPHPDDHDENNIYLADIFRTWDNAVQVHNDSIMSAAAVVVGVLLQVLSADLSTVRHALGVCEALLQERQLKLLDRNLSSDTTKGYIISPTLRLLQEIVTLDGGVLARRVFRLRQHTLAEFVRNLEVRPSDVTDGVAEDLAKASVRTNAIRLFINLLRFLPADDRKDLIMTRGLMSHLTFLFKDDAPSVLSELLESLTKYFVTESKIPPHVRSVAFSAKILARFLTLYVYSHDTDGKYGIADRTHKMLVLLCTSKNHGIMQRSTGLYPEGIDPAAVTSGHERVGRLGIESLRWMETYKSEVPVVNTGLLEFLLKLRPWANLQHSELIVGAFKECPELISAYFRRQINFTFDPKLSMTWIGYAAFLFSTVALPLPENFGDAARVAADIPPPSSIVLDNILPPSLNQKVLVRCLDPKSSLVSFFATRLLVLSMQKFQAALQMHQESSESPMWRHAQRKLLNEFCQRIPDMKEVVRSYKAIPVENVLHRTAASQLLSLYYKHVPQVALAANFDASPLLISALRRLEGEFDNAKDKAMAIVELENLLEISSFSPGMRWFAKIENMDVSPFTALVRLACNKSFTFHSVRLESTLSNLAVEHQIVSKKFGLKPFFEAVRNTDDVDDEEWQFIDNCLQRSSASPLKYVDLLKEYIGEEETSKSYQLSLLFVTLAEQVPHVCKTADDEVLMTLAELLSAYANNVVALGETEPLITALCVRIKEHLPWLTLPDPPVTKQTPVETTGDAMDIDEPEVKPEETAEYANILEPIVSDLTTFEIDNQALTRWVNKTPEDLVDDGYATTVFKLLLSEHISIRREALVNLMKMAGKIKESTHPENEQIWLLISELVESARPYASDGPVPTQFVAFAVHALPILNSPLHALYPKINKFLTKGPIWAATKLPVIHDILHGEPSEDDKLYLELSWLISYLTDCLYLKEDISLFHRNNWLEKVLCVACNPNLRMGLRVKMQKLIYKITTLEGGSTMLITRFGIISWLKTQEAVFHASDEKAIFKALTLRVWDTCSKEHVEKWGGAGVERTVKP